jgi:DNA-binding PadR family transcriptional regulator
MYPYEITTTLRERNKEDSIRLNFGSLYAVIKALAKHGFIQVERVEQEGNRPERVVYAITTAGRREADEWVRELLAVPVKEYPAIETGLSLLAMVPPEEAAVLLRRRVALIDADIDRRRAEAADPAFTATPQLFTVEFGHRLAMLQAERDAIAGLADRIESGAIGGFDLWTEVHRLLAAGNSMTEVSERLAPYFTAEAVVSTPEQQRREPTSSPNPPD